MSQISLNSVEAENFASIAKLYPNQKLIINSVPTGIGEYITVVCPDGEVIDITDYECW